MKVTFTKNWSLVVMALVFGSLSLTAQTLIYSETFGGGIPAGWTNVGVSSNNPDSTANALWQWTPDGRLDAGSFWGNGGTIQSPTVSDGAVGFDSDFLDNAGGGIPALGTGSAPSPQVSELISPIIDCSSNSSVAVKFNQSYRNFSSQPRIEVSGDGGATWTPYQVNAGVSGSIDPATVTIIDVTAVAANSANVQVKFVWDGDYYFWIVDDFELTTLPNNNLSLGDFLFPARHQFTPISQVDADSMFFSIDITNAGGAAQPNTVITAEIVDDNNTTIHSETLNVGTVTTDVADSTFDIGSGFDPSTLAVGTYTVNYTISSDSMDFDMTDNMVTEDFVITDSLFSKEAGATNGLRPGGGGDYQVGAYYNMSPNFDPAVEEYYAKTVRFACAKNASDGALAGDQVTIFLYEVNAADDFNDFDVNSDANLTIVGSADYTFGSESNYDIVTLTLTDFNTGGAGVPLTPGGKYFLTASYAGASNVIFHAFNNTINYFQISTITKSSQWFLGGFGPEDAAVMRMGLERIAISSDEVQLPEESVNVFPNPANDFVTLDLNFDTPSDALVTITDMTGRVIRANDYTNVSSQKFNYNTADLPAGTYIIRVSTNEGAKSKRFVVAH